MSTLKRDTRNNQTLLTDSYRNRKYHLQEQRLLLQCQLQQDQKRQQFEMHTIKQQQPQNTPHTWIGETKMAQLITYCTHNMWGKRTADYTTLIEEIPEEISEETNIGNKKKKKT